MKKNLMIILFVGILMSFTACGQQEENKSNSTSDSTLDNEEIFSDRDFETEYSEGECAHIYLNGDSATSESNAVDISGSTITIKDEGTYVISGTLENGMIIVDLDEEDKTQLVLDGASIHSETSAAIYILESDKVFITLNEDSENTLSNGGTFENIDENDMDGVIFSKSDLTLNGKGNLNITSPGGHGIVSKDDLIFTSGTYNLDVASHGLSANDMLGIAGGAFYITSGEDSVHCDTNVQIEDGIFEISAGDDAIHADTDLNICGGTIRVLSSYEGLEALNVKVLGGDITIVASDDGLNAAGGNDQSGFNGIGTDQFAPNGGGPSGGAGGRPGGGNAGGGIGAMTSGSSNGSIVISGGTLYIKASGDGIDANGTLEITGGNITVCGPTQGDTATLDYDTSAVITGGTFIGTGAMNMAQTFSDSEQGVIAVSVGNQQAGSTITLTDSDGNTVISYEPELSFAVVILSSEDIKKGETYTITVGDVSGEFEAE